ncbi:MAG: cytochrome c biogenesis heme-transporting ATPase CcmA [Burkholderiales bacterium]|nr:cytochrome c biogenesis heme-transporting ATPase CcmA [Burkholderiales bacterium]
MATRSADLSVPLLQVEGLACRRGERLLFSGFALRLEPGRIVWLRGANGQGKTTLLRTLAGLSEPEAGTMAWREPQPLGPALYLAHANALKDELTAFESLRFLLALAGNAPADSAIDAALARFGMAGRRAAPVRTLSQGQRRRVALARLALPGTASTWLLDEPFDALDAGGVEILNALLVEHVRGGGGVVLTSHLPLTISDPMPATVSLDEAVAA